MDRLKTIRENRELYNAGLPHFPRNFTRDSIISALLMGDREMLHRQLRFCGERQGTRCDPRTGEEPGKIFHEHPGFGMDGRSTEYNACDTTALYLIGHERYRALGGDATLADECRDSILAAAAYIESHLSQGVFVEDPSHCGTDRFALKVTYWKDSELAQRPEGSPAYPVAYYLAHAMNLAGMRSAARLLGSAELEQAAQRMRGHLDDFFDIERRQFAMAVDRQGPVVGVSSDMLHALYYLEPGDLSEEVLRYIDEAAAELETPLGYRTLSPMLESAVADQYHASTVWPFEQAIINAGARTFGLSRVGEVSARIRQHLDTDPEIFILSPEGTRKGGCDPQLWTIAAKRYFTSLERVVLSTMRE